MMRVRREVSENGSRTFRQQRRGGRGAPRVKHHTLSINNSKQASPCPSRAIINANITHQP